MNVVTAEIPNATPLIRDGTPIETPQQIEAFFDEASQRVEAKEAKEAKAWFDRQRIPVEKYNALYSDEAHKAGSVPGYRFRTISTQWDTQDIMSAGNPADPNKPRATVEILRHNFVMSIMQNRKMLTEQQGNGVWHLWLITKVVGHKRVSQHHTPGGTSESWGGNIRAQRVVTEASDMAAMGESVTVDKISTIARAQLRYDLVFVDISGRADVDHNNRPIVTGPQPSSGADDAITRLANALAPKTAPAPAADVDLSGVPTHHPLTGAAFSHTERVAIKAMMGATSAPVATDEPKTDQFPGIPTHGEDGKPLHWQTRKRMFTEKSGG